MSLAANIVLLEDSARVLALYPAKALIQDQREKWREMLAPLGIGFSFIDGTVPPESRPGILRSSSVVLMTPDVAHAWLLSHLEDRAVAQFLQSLRLLILDEAHVYEGAFGTNMAYFLRRLQAASRPYQVIVSTATMGTPTSFMSELLGRVPVCFGPESDGSAAPPKTILLARNATGDSFNGMVELLLNLTKTMRGHFLAFADSRRMVEQVVAATHRKSREEDEDDDDDDDDSVSATTRSTSEQPQIMPFRAGYEAEDRASIQSALSRGRMVGVVSTSAMELGIDIGEIDIVVLLGIPPSAKALWQRLGRAGRKNDGACLMIDDRGTLGDSASALDAFLRRPLEPSWLYLENRYIQYAQALCAATEIAAYRNATVAFQSLPASFRGMLENEIHPTEIVPADLYPLKQKAQGGPQLEFPIRTAIEQNFRVRTAQSIPLGTVTFSQALREAYPDGIYHYMARPYRVLRFDYKSGEILARRERHWTTRPISQTMVFPRFQGGSYLLLKSTRGFLAEAEMQVSERVVGFTEQRGPNKEEHRYGPGSPYFQRDITRFFATTGVCWYFGDKGVESEAVAGKILEAFCAKFGVQERDLGVGLFFTKQAPVEPSNCHGACVFDATNGSLRLTQRLAERFPEVLRFAIETANNQSDLATARLLRTFASLDDDLRPDFGVVMDKRISSTADDQQEWVTVIATEQPAMYLSDDGPRKVLVKGYRYTPHGLMYQLEPSPQVDRWMVAANALEPIFGETKMLQANLVTGETQDPEHPPHQGSCASA
jgi:DEAD/DEAH box helicase domain-containing protein